MRTHVVESRRRHNFHHLRGALPGKTDKSIIDCFVVLYPDGHKGVGCEADLNRLDNVAVKIVVCIDKLVDDESVLDPKLDSIVAIYFKAVHL